MAVRNLKWVLTGEDKSASKSLDNVGRNADKLHHRFSAVGAALAGGAIGAGIVEFGKKATDAAVEGQESQARLAQAIKNTGGSLEEVEPKIHALTDRFAKFGFTNDEVEGALAQMTTSLRSPTKALDAMGLAADLAKYKHISLADASLTVAKAMEGQLRPLKQLGIDLPVAAGGALKLEHAHTAVAKAQQKVNDVLAKYPDALNKTSKHHEQYQRAVMGVTAAEDKLAETQNAAQAITKGLAAAVGGQATAASNTYAGKIAALHARMANLTEQIGMKLLPVMAKMMGIFLSAAALIQRHTTLFKVLLGVVTAVTAVVLIHGAALKVVAIWQKILAVGTKAWAAAQWLLNAALDANPIGLVVIALTALVVGLVLAYKHSQTFRDIVHAAFSAISTAASAMWSVLKTVFKLWADAWLVILGVLVHGAAKAFGWVPGIGGKLKNAAKEFDKFKTAVNKSLDGVTPDKTITIHALTTSETAATTRAITAQDNSGRGAVQRQHRGTTTTHVTNVHLDGKKVATVVTKHQNNAAGHGHLKPGQV